MNNQATHGELPLLHDNTKKNIVLMTSKREDTRNWHLLLITMAMHARHLPHLLLLLGRLTHGDRPVRSYKIGIQFPIQTSSAL